MYSGLTAFRAIAFLSVFFYHVGIFPIGYLGVEAFFVLSGFLLTPILLEMRTQLPPRQYFLNFYGRRALRIFPLYYAYLLVLVVIFGLVRRYEGYVDIEAIERFFQQLPWALTYTLNFYELYVGPETIYSPFVSPAWSLAVEEQFYLFWPLMLFFVPKRNMRLFLLLIAILGLACRVFIMITPVTALIPDAASQPKLLLAISMITRLPFSHVDSLAIGGYFALYQKGTVKRSTGIILTLMLMFSLASLLYASLFLVTDELIRNGLEGIRRWSDLFLLVPAWGLTIFNLVIAYQLVAIRDKRFFAKLFSNKVLLYLGKISYGLYLIHHGLLWTVEQLLPFMPLFLQALLALILSILIAALSYEWMEVRFIALKDRFFPRQMT